VATRPAISPPLQLSPFENRASDARANHPWRSARHRGRRIHPTPSVNV
jgi:hypothetical protein